MASNKRTESQPETQHDEEHFTDKSKKEEGESNGESKGESNGSSTQEVRALIDNNQVGGIIGKAGANVKRVRDESSAFVSILKSDNRNVTERVMVLKGTPAQIQHAIHLIAELLIESANSKDNKNNNNTTTDSTAIKLLVHRSAVGAIIGKSGNVIKETQTETNARVQVSNEPLPQSTEKTVTITGTADAIKAAVTKILKQLKDNPLRSGTKVFPYVPGQSMFPGSGYGLGYPSQLPLYTQPASLSGSSSATPQQSSTQKIAIPTVCAGCVIGKGGSVIRDLRAQSGTNISIADPEPSQPNERVVTLTGTPQGIQAAVFLIRQLVEQYQPPSNYN